MTRDGGRDAGREWVRYWRSAEPRLEAMHAHFCQHTYHTHSHETYSFGVTEAGAQTFTCRGAAHVSSAGLVMAFNPDDPHNGHAATEQGFTYRMVHVGPEVVADVLTGITPGAAPGQAALPLFPDPVIDVPGVYRSIRKLYDTLTGQASPLERDEQLAATLTLLVRHAATRSPPAMRALRTEATAGNHQTARVAARMRAFLHDSYAAPVRSADLAVAAGCSRYAAYRAFRAVFGLAPSEYQRQLRLRAARRRLADGSSAAQVAADVGFADQAHLTRWFGRCYGVTPAVYRLAAAG